MFGTRFLAVVAVLGWGATPVLAQTAAPAAPARPPLVAPAVKPPVATAPTVKPPVVASPAVASPGLAAPVPAPSTKLVNLNTATPSELDALPDVGKARSKAILAERAKGRFRDWSDFDTRMARTSVNAGVKAKIKSRVTF